MIQVVVKNRTRLSIFMIVLAVLQALEMKVNSTLQKILGCKMTEKGPKTFMQFLMGESYPLHIHCHENLCLTTLEGGGTPIAHCSV